MDTDTLNRWRTLAVREHKPTFNEVSHLTESEAAALESLREDDLRLEQERIPWPYALKRLLVTFGAGQSSAAADCPTCPDSK